MKAKQQRFIEEYLIDLNATQAAIRAGYAPGSAHVSAARLLKNDKIAAAIQEGMDKRSERTEVTQEWVVAQLVSVYKKAVENNATNAANRSLELLGKHLGIFRDVVEVKRGSESLTDAELEHIATGHAARGSNGTSPTPRRPEEPDTVH